ncbi:hypothetical protein M947_01920 [Sulfurimonas hongkongensis]|uniref:HTH crp-type domain-containing protein n=1 Tax=Sulfurimonas hongkongensis TaxID=1172190 RepID=T0JHJ3_9BACT|nr:Crp/Fnr family transcriptional regulator [Sulfurimonas hongkongensis]EQB40585.1 hypothetical protein M947_01920 [Sulfurimonas hongkongensis]
MSIREILESLIFFSSLDAKEIELLSSFCTLTTYANEYVLHYENEQSQNLEFLISGLAKSYKIDKHKNEIFLYYIYKNSLLSEIESFKSQTLNFFSNISIVEESLVLNIDYGLFKENFLDKQKLCLELSCEVNERSQKLQSLINREFIYDSVQKVSMMLHSDLEMFNKLKRHDISLILHIQPATLSRVLNRLKRNNIIDIIHGRIKVLDSKALKEVAND